MKPIPRHKIRLSYKPVAKKTTGLFIFGLLLSLCLLINGHASADETYDMHVRPGWNTFAFPLIPSTNYTAETLLQEINRQGGFCTVLMRWDGSGWEAHGLGTPFGDFPIQWHEGYFVYSNRVTTWQLTGTRPTFPQQRSFHPGWNLVAIPSIPPFTKDYTAESLSQEIISQGGWCGMTLLWDGSGWETHGTGLPFGDYSIRPDKGYFLYCTGYPTWTSSSAIPRITSFTITDSDSNSSEYTNSTSVNISIDVSSENTISKWLITQTPTLPSVDDFTLTSKPTTHTIVSTEDGEVALYAWALDNQGKTNQLEPMSQATITLDATPPTVNVTTPRNKSLTDTSQPNIAINYSDASGIDASTVKLSLNTQDVTSLCTITASNLTFAPTIELPDQPYDVEVKVSDSAGNIKTTSSSFTVYTGEVIGTQGGSITSPDGRIKLDIPEGALSSPTKIRVVTAEEAGFTDDEVPDEHSLAIAGDFRPMAQSFNKDIKLTFFPKLPEIPGTPIALYLYNRNQGRFESTGMTSQVSKQGTDVSFSIRHFSTYGALTNLISQGTAFGSGVQIPTPDMFTGAFGHSVKINVPPGRKSIQPNLTLQYRSSSSNSWLGLGWDINPGFITRSTKLGPPSYNDEEDRFLFVSDSGSTELVHLTDNLYQARIESNFAKFLKEEDDSWTIINKDGTTLTLGTTTNSKEISSNGTFSWYMTKFKDTNTNYISLTYIKSDGRSYLSRIDYTGNENAGVLPLNTVEFAIEDRTDKFSSFKSSSKITTAKRLQEIQTMCNGEAVFRYVFEYEYSPDTNRSLLKRVRTYTSDNKEFPAQEFNYQEN